MNIFNNNIDNYVSLEKKYITLREAVNEIG